MTAVGDGRVVDERQGDQIVNLWQDPFHDGSPRYVPDPPQRLGDTFDVLLRVPRVSGVDRVWCRQVLDGEPFMVAAQLDREEPDADWYRASLVQHQPMVNYRFLTNAGPNKYRWTTAIGQLDHDPPDSGDFRSSIHPGAPEWVYGSIGYQIFPDRFARGSDEPIDFPSWSRPATHWDELPAWGDRDEPLHYFGGDLAGIEERLGYLSDLGIDLVYLTPVFPGPSNHRYNADSFDHVDPLLGGDVALVSLVSEAHRRGMRVIGDITTNHTGSQHQWFQKAQQDIDSDEASFYYFNEHPDDYVAWWGVSSLPKLNYASTELRERMITAPEGPIRRYLAQPFALDGWRVDVANMTGRQGEADLNEEVAELIRQTMHEENPDAYLVGEHFHDYTEDVRPTGWQGVMNYAGFSVPLWQWLSSPSDPMRGWLGIEQLNWPRLPGAELVAGISKFNTIPWQQRMASLLMIDSHDTPRIRSITGATDLVEVAATAMFTMPGVPMMWMGTELGLEGVTGEDARRTMPWERPEQWQKSTMAAFEALIKLHRNHEALRDGSLRWVFADDDRVVYLREGVEDVLLILLARAAGPSIEIPAAAVGAKPNDEWQQIYPFSQMKYSAAELNLPTDGPTSAVYVLRPGT